VFYSVYIFNPSKANTQGVTGSQYGHTDVDLSRKHTINKQPCIVTHMWFHLVCCWSTYGLTSEAVAMFTQPCFHPTTRMEESGCSNTITSS